MKLFIQILAGIFVLFVLYILICMSIGVVIGVFIRYAFIIAFITIITAAVRSAYNRRRTEKDAIKNHVSHDKKAEKMLNEMERNRIL